MEDRRPYARGRVKDRGTRLIQLGPLSFLFVLITPTLMHHNQGVAKVRGVFSRERAEFDRGLAFFDAIYGFAITLLIANVDMPPAEAWRDLGTLLSGGVGIQLTGFAISFIVIAAFWSRNASLISEFSGLDGTVIAANLVTAGLIVLLPFTTQGMSDPALTDVPLPTMLYAANVALIMTSLVVTREVGRIRGLVAVGGTLKARWAPRIDAAAQILVFVVSIPVAAYASADWAKVVWIALIPVGVLFGAWSGKVLEADREAIDAEAVASESG